MIKNLTIGSQTDRKEQEFALASALLFLNEYQEDRRSTTYAELAYYLILKYCLVKNQYQALYDFSANFGYYPITRKLLADELVAGEKIIDELVDLHLDNYSKDGYVETSHQAKARTELMADESSDIVYVAPTSFGKSSIIVDYIRTHQRNDIKIAIIVPTKSLLMQTYRMIRKAGLSRRLITHDEMYRGESSFIAILTQERCLRLLAKTAVSFDLVFIDEAHNLFDGDARSILLSRVLTQNIRRNPDQRVVYLSPLIDDAINVQTRPEQPIEYYSIPFNVKEPDIFELRNNKRKYQYNRFVNDFYPLNRYTDIFHYIFQHARGKNFLYCRRPIHVEQLAKELAKRLPIIPLTPAIQTLIRTLKNEVHELFYLVDLVEHGVVYLHGKMPDIIKEYLESKFNLLSELRYLVANSVILEGVNLPIDNLYILSTHALQGKELTNLIGRVNRLNTIFGPDAPPSAIRKLVPPVHFLNNDDYNRKNGKMENKIRQLRSRIFKDELRNCTLEQYDIEDLKLGAEEKARKRQNDQIVLRDEAALHKEPRTEQERFRQYLIESSIAGFYNDLDEVIETLYQNLSTVQNGNDNMDFMEKIYQICIHGLTRHIGDENFRRLENAAARRFYKNYVKVVQKRSMKQNIIFLYEYYKKEIDRGNIIHYFGTAYGEELSPHAEVNNHRLDYLDLSGKSRTEIINLCIVKLKMEDDFVSFKINKVIVMLHDFNLLSDDEFHELVYGTTNQAKIELTKLGMSISLINRLEDDDLLDLLELDLYGNLVATPAFNERKAGMPDLYRFEVSRFLD
jgi:superfamily II DNA or RNA helicase